MQALTNMGEVRRAAERLGVSVEEAAERVAERLDLDAIKARADQRRFDIPHLAAEERGYQIMKEVRIVARSL